MSDMDVLDNTPPSSVNNNNNNDMNLEEDNNNNNNINQNDNDQVPMNVENDESNINIVDYYTPPPEPGRKKATDINYLKWNSEHEHIDIELNDKDEENEYMNHFIKNYFKNEFQIKHRKVYKKTLQIIKEMLERKITSIMSNYQISSFPICKTNTLTQIKYSFDIYNIDEQHQSLIKLRDLASEYIEISKKITKKNKDIIKAQKNQIKQYIGQIENENFDEILSSIENFIFIENAENQDNSFYVNENDVTINDEGKFVHKDNNSILSKTQIVINVPYYDLNAKFDENLILENTKFGVKYIRQYLISKIPSSKKNVKNLLDMLKDKNHIELLKYFTKKYEETDKDTKTLSNSSFIAQYLYECYKYFIPSVETFRFIDTNEGPHVKKRILDGNEQLLNITVDVANELYAKLSYYISLYEFIKELLYRFNMDDVEENLSIEKLNIPSCILPQTLLNDLYFHNVYKYYICNKFMTLYDKEGYEARKDYYMKKISDKSLNQRIISHIIDKNGKLNKKSTKKFITTRIDLYDENIKTLLSYLYNINLENMDSLNFRIGITLVEKQQSLTKYELSKIIYKTLFKDNNYNEQLFNISSNNINDLYEHMSGLYDNFEKVADDSKDELTKKYYKFFIVPIPPNKAIVGNIGRYKIK